MGKTEKAETNGFTVAALIFGIFSLLTGISMLLPVPNCIFAVVFALLSRGSRKMSGMAVAGLVLGITGLVIGLLTAYALFSWVRELIKAPQLLGAFGRMLLNFLDLYGAGGLLR